MTLHLQISNQTGVPAYRQIMNQIEDYHQSGALKAHDQLPSIRQLAKQVAVNPGTVVKAYQKLEHQKTIYSLHGKGVFVSEVQAKRLGKREREEPIRDALQQLWLQAKRMDLSEADLQRITSEEYNNLRNQ